MSSKQNNDSDILAEYKAKFIKYGIIAIIILAVILAIIFKARSDAYSKATNKYEAVVAELKQQIEEMSDPVAAYTTATKEVNFAFLESEIKDIGELAAVEYMYTDAGKFENPKQIFGKNIPFTTKSFIAKWDGIIKAGVNMDAITVDVNDESKKIIVHMPKAKILSHEIDSESVETLNEKNGLFNPVKVEDIRKFDAVSKDKMEERAVENGLLDKAFDNSKEIIEKIINNDAVREQGYTIEFETIE